MKGPIKKEKYAIDIVLEKRLPTFFGRCQKHNHPQFVDFDGDSIKMCGRKYTIFLKRGTDCIQCGLQGKFFRKEKFCSTEPYFTLNLYGVKENEEILISLEHVIPLAYNGKPTANRNLVPMCLPCNTTNAKRFWRVESWLHAWERGYPHIEWDIQPVL